MGFPLEKTPARIKIRIWGHSGCFYVLKRVGDCWESIGHYKTRESAAGRVELELQLMKWATEVKIKDGWVCKRCGELDRTLLESHHIKTKSENPEYMFDVNNGKCLCLWCHALAHWSNVAIRTMILARLGLITGKRNHPKDKKLVA